MQLKSTHASHIRVNNEARGVAQVFGSRNSSADPKTSTAKPRDPTQDSMHLATAVRIDSASFITEMKETFDIASVPPALCLQLECTGRTGANLLGVRTGGLHLRREGLYQSLLVGCSEFFLLAGETRIIPRNIKFCVRIMELDAGTKARIKSLSEEMDEIHNANREYWKQGESQTLAAKTEYALRNERLERIRAELAQLRSQ